MLFRKPIAKQWKKEVKKILKQIRLTDGTVQLPPKRATYIYIYVPSEEQGNIQGNLKSLRGIVYSLFTSGTTKEPYLCRQDSTSVVV